MPERASFEFPIGGIDDGVVRLRFHTEADLEAVASASLDPEIVRWTRVPDDNTAASVAEWIDGWRASGDELHLLIVGADDGALLGTVGVLRHDPGERRCEVGYWVARAARGRGVATRAVRLLSSWAFENLGVNRVGIAVEPENAGSRAVAERAGFAYEGTLRSWLVMKDRPRDVAMYSLLRGESPQAD